MKVRNIAVSLLLPLTLSACMFHGGSPKHVSTTTLGQELMDLKLALEEGAITEPEYRALKERLQSGEKAEMHSHCKDH